MTDTQQEIQWYIARDGKQHGPLTESEMNLFIKDGHLKPTDLLWKAGFPDWKPAPTIFASETTPSASMASKQVEKPKSTTEKSISTSRAATTSHANPKSGHSENAKANTSTVNLSSRAPSANQNDGTRQADPAANSLKQQHVQQQRHQTATQGTATFNQPGSQPSPTASTTPTNGSGAQHVATSRSIDPDAPFAPHLRRPASQPAAGKGGNGPATSARSAGTKSSTPLSTGQSRPSASGSESQGSSSRGRLGQSKKAGDQKTNASNPGIQIRRPERAPTPRRNGASAVQVLVTVAAIVFVSGAAYFGYTYSDQLTSLTSSLMPTGTGLDSTAPPPVVSPKKETKTAAPTAVTRAPVIDPGTATPSGATSVSITNLDSQLQKSALWALLKNEYPTWYSERLKQASDMTAAGDDPLVVKKLLTEIVELRRKHANDALAATPQKLEGIAAAFLNNLKRLSEHSTEACYTFISKGELSPQVVELMTTTTYRPSFEAQTTRIFEAISEGRKSPIKRERANKEDYNVLARQLGTMGWTQTDLQLFANPRALAAAPPARVCKLVQDWFAAHIELSDTNIKDRLLFETLRPVVAG